VFWAAYYKWYIPAAIIAIIYVILFLFGLPGLAVLGLINIVISIFAGFKFKTEYVRHVYRKIADLKAIESDPQRLKDLLQRQGGTSSLNVFLMIIFICLASVALNQILPQQIMTLAENVAIPSSVTTVNTVSNNDDDVPACDSADGIRLAKYKLNQMVEEKEDTLKAGFLERGWEREAVQQNFQFDRVLDISQASETSYDASKHTRHCKGLAEGQKYGSVNITYHFRALNDGTIDVKVDVSAEDAKKAADALERWDPTAPVSQPSLASPAEGVPVNADDFLKKYR
jgi:hypothetical protein